jgi:L-threonylcarbamoyladenylate synthase
MFSECRKNMTQQFETDINKAVEALLHGRIIVYPTDTVWGIGCDATDSDAVGRVYALKQREDSKAMIVLVPDLETMLKYTGHCSEVMVEQVKRMLSDTDARPTTFVLPAGNGLASNLLAPDGSVGLRITNEYFSQRLCRSFGRPVVSTSANISGKPAARFFGEIEPAVTQNADYVCTSRRNDNTASVPSRVVKINLDGSLTIIRP